MILIHKGTQTINTNRLSLRKFKIDDAHNMFKNWVSDREVSKFLSWKPHENVEFTKILLTQWVSESENNNVYNWAIELKEIGEVIGSICVVTLNEDYYSCEIGYCISRKYWGSGITSEALTGVIDYLFSEVGVNRIEAKFDTNNAASGKVMIKSGMTYEGTLRQIKVRNDMFYNLAVYSILRDEWLENKK